MNKKPPFLSIVIPAHNEAFAIGDILDQLAALRLDAEVIVVDDGSTDETTEVVRARSWVNLIRHPYNLGNGAAVKSGIRSARGELLLIMDGDGQHNPKDIPRLVERLVTGGYDMVVGARKLRPDNERHRDLANKIFQVFASYIAGRKIDDLTSGFRVLRTEIARSFIGLLPRGFSSPSTLTLAVVRSGYSVCYEAIDLQRRQSKSKVRLLNDGLQFLLIILRMGVLFAPLRIFIPVTTVVFTLGVGYGAFLLIFMQRFSNMAALLILAGIILFLMGLISEQIAMLRLMQAGSLKRDL